MEKAQLPSPDHASYQNHRRELWRQILTPLLIATAFIVAIAVWTGIATFRDHGEVERWAAISTMWIVIPAMFAGLIFLLLIGGMIYGMARLLKLIPPYTSLAQTYVWRAQAYIKRGTEIAVSPVFSIESILASIRYFLGMK